MKDRINGELLNKAIKDECRLKNGLSVIFVTKEKHPGLKSWQKLAQEDQTDDEIRALYRKRGSKNTAYSYFTGVGGLIDIDFDWEWTYHVALRHFGDRMETRTIKTPNGGYRALFIVERPENFLDYKNRPPRVEIHGNGSHVIVHGAAKDDNGDLKEYELIKDVGIRHDDRILPEIIEFLTGINQECSFLEYKCIANKLKNKRNYLTQEQRTSIGSFFAAEDIDFRTAVDFFRTCDDFDEKVTSDHLRRLYEKRFKHLTCDKLREHFDWDEPRCAGCPRKKETVNEVKDHQRSDEVEIGQFKVDEFFQLTEKDGEFYAIEDITTPIFEINKEISFATPLKTVPTTEGEKKTIGFYGSKSGYGFEPISFNRSEDSAVEAAVVFNVKQPKNQNQYRILEQCIRKAIKKTKKLKKSPQSVFTKVETVDVGAVQDDICEKLQYYMKLEYPDQYMIITCWILGTYLFPLFNNFGYLIVSGEKGAGKGTILDLLGEMCWNASSKLVSISEAGLFRLIKEQLPTMIIDEYHRMVENRNMGGAIESIIEVGYEKGGAVGRTEQVKGLDGTISYETFDYQVYCPKVLATRDQVEADEKGIKIFIPKIYFDKKYAERKKELLDDTFFNDVRERLMNWVIMSQHQVMAASEEIKPTEKLSGREYIVWLPVLAICKVAFPDRYEELLRFAEKQVSISRSDVSEKEMRVLTALNYLLPELEDGGRKLKNPSYKVTNREIKEAHMTLEGYGIHHGTIKSALQNLMLIGKLDQGTYYIEKGKLRDKLLERGLGTPSSEYEAELLVEDLEKSTFHDTYEVLVDCDGVTDDNFPDLLREKSGESLERCQAAYKQLKREGYIDLNPEGFPEPSDLLRDKMEI